MESPLYLRYPVNAITFNGTYARGIITSTFNSTGTFSVTKQSFYYLSKTTRPRGELGLTYIASYW